MDKPDRNAGRLQPCSFRSPEKRNAQFRCAVDQQPMQNRPAQTNPGAIREIGNDRRLPVRETNSPKAKTKPGRYRYSEIAQRGNAIRHQALSTTFVDGRNSTIGQTDRKAFLT